MSRRKRRHAESTRKRRHDEFTARMSGGSSSISGTLYKCAFALLERALQQRTEEVARMRDNHFTHFAAGSILLLVAAFEAWLNEVILLFGHRGVAALEETANLDSLSKRYEQTSRGVDSATIFCWTSREAAR